MFLQIFGPLASPDQLLSFSTGLALQVLTLLLFLVPQRQRLENLEALSPSDRLAHLENKVLAIEVAAADRVAELSAGLQAVEGVGADGRLSALESLSYFDPETALRSGALFRSELAALVRQDRPIVLLYIDLDDFAAINERGHTYGDAAIFLAAQALRQAVPRSSDRLYRLHRAGDEFAAVAEASEADGQLLAERIQEALSARGLSATIGLAASDRYPWRDLEGAADRACLEQKKVQKGRYRVAVEPIADWAEHLSRVQMIEFEGGVGPHPGQAAESKAPAGNSSVRS